ncbi:MAG: imidazoleglycerol-phosphate dehydratase [Moorella sp. (in: firmicutes)]|jgi:imidazoleglycerol-phosphate dehydratase|uniref:imidazoleglycerol-phosphate dehydratase HisB n=1 Tax=Moorella sp. E306M TaxID=2572683 RepID=UPI0010FFB30E|nr:imidazoleglycerol-phosphate dehydratase HisB [Moorella sp. E306M]MDK2817390.1 imidazoleglycerol-phosphate dehydratase [Moorella sp. (in: firmicutes)]MDK2895511.1 imidazoleglycerol-phosphate dehydratase [Moorella sp. (in: firmicutes)]GEA18627.1 imidazoleglycerol-phosphate dehydratase [Moorella sp. E306M]
MSREALIERQTTETSIRVKLDLDGSGKWQGSSGIPFFDHLLAQLARHGLLDLKIWAEGDLEVDNHHTVEDIGICLGEAIKKALGDKAGINRYGSALVPMDEALVQVALDFSGRPYLACNLDLPPGRIGSLETELLEEFLRAFVNHSGLTLHVQKLAGRNGHHVAEALFKALGRAIREAASRDPRVEGPPSTKGSLD